MSVYEWPLKTGFTVQFSFLFSPDDKHPWIQIDFKKPKLLSGIITQGENGGQRWLTKYYVTTSFDGKHFIPYANHPGEAHRVFNGNTDSTNPIRNLFNRNITAQYLRVYPVAWHGSSPALRLDILGCNPDNPQSPFTTLEPPTTVSPGSNTGAPTLTPPMGGTGSPSRTTIPPFLIPFSCKLFM